MAASGRRPLVAGNWKMNGLRLAAAAELQKIVAAAPALAGTVELMMSCEPAFDYHRIPGAGLLATLAWYGNIRRCTVGV